MQPLEAPQPRSEDQGLENNPYNEDGELWSGAGQFVFGEDGQPTGIPKEHPEQPQKPKAQQT